MLVQFSIKNYKTFKDLNKLSLVASNYDKTNEDANSFSIRKFNYRLLKSAVVYGANASGKSKFFEAYQTFRQIVFNSSKESQANDKINVTPFILDSKSEKEPTAFEIVLLQKGSQFRYGFEANKQKIFKEWLFIKSATKEEELFFRQSQKFEYNTKIESAGDLIRKNMIRDNALLLSVLAQFNDKTAKSVLDGLKKISIISGIDHERFEGFTSHQLENEQKIKKAEIIRFLSEADFGIEDLKASSIDKNNLPEDMPDQLKEMIQKRINEKQDVFIYDDVFAFRKKYSNGKPLNELVSMSMTTDESSGTRKYFALSGPVLDTLKEGTTLFVDELDSQMHPLLVRHLIKLFNSREYNPKNAQLIFNTHDINLLNGNIFRRDQIWFSEKDKTGSAKLFSLFDFKVPNSGKIRNDENYEKNYMQGKYGAIPYVSKLEFIK